MKSLFLILIFLLSGCAGAFNVGPPGTQRQIEIVKTAGGLPSLEKVTFVNTTYFNWQNLSGKVVLVVLLDFNNPQENQSLSALNNWYDTFHKYDFEIVGIHEPKDPRFFSLTDLNKIIRKYDIKYPMVVDNEQLLWAGFGRFKKPFFVLVDGLQNIRGRVPADGDYYDQINTYIINGLQEQGKGPIETVNLEPDISLGYEKGKIGNAQEIHGFVPINYIDNTVVYVPGIVYLNGVWATKANSYIYNGDNINYPQYSDYLGFRFYSANVAILAQNKRVLIKLDDAPIPPSYQGEDVKTDGSGNTYIIMDKKRVYNMVKNLPWSGGAHVLRFYPEPGFEIYRIIFPVGENWKLK